MLAPCPSRDLPDSLLKRIQGFWRNNALDLRTSGKAEPEKLPAPAAAPPHSSPHLPELELLCDESRYALRHPLARPLAANVDVTVIRISNEAMASAPQLPIEFVQHEVAEQWRKWTSSGVPSTLGLTNPFSITPAFKNARMSFNSRLSSTRLAI